MYGMLVAEMDSSNLTNVTPVSYQLAVTLKSLLMIEEQNKAKENLQTSLNQFMEDNSRLDTIAKTDELTGLYNRRGFLDYAQLEIGKPENKGKRALICYADMDNLKYVNDKFGHPSGDKYITDFAKVLITTFDETGFCARIGGDEFLVILEDSTEKDVDALLGRMNSALNVMNAIYSEYHRSVATGYAFRHECAENATSHEVYLLADQRMYELKRKMHEELGIHNRL
jgi:diguanylate cyclase (GGDEF)-like protein